MKRIKILIPLIILTVIIIVLVILLNPSHRYDKLSVSESKWNSIITSRINNTNLALESIKFNDFNLIIDDDTLYYSVINDSQNKYNPNVSFRANADNAKVAILQDEITDEKVHSSYEFKLMVYNNTEYHIYNLVCTDFPILNIMYNELEESKQKNIPAKVYLFNNLSNTANRILISDGKFRINEDNYALSLHMLTPGKNKRENKKSIFNMPPHSEYILTEAVGDTGGLQLIELFINNEYKGQFLITTHVIERKTT